MEEIKNSRTSFFSNFDIFKKWLWLILLSAAIATALASFYIWKSPLKYSATTILMVNQPTSRDFVDINALTASERLTKTFAEVVTKRPVLEKIIETLELNITPEDLAKQINPELLPDTQLLQINVSSNDPQLSADIANTAAQALIDELAALQSDLSAQSRTKIEIVERAKPATQPSLPSKKQKTLALFIFNFVLAAILVYLIEITDTSIRSNDELAAYLNLPSLGTIGALGRNKTDEMEKIAESLKEIRTNISFINPKNPLKTMAVTSALSKEGKSFVATNIAIAMAKAGKKVALIDADMRKPAIHRYFKLENSSGLSNILKGQKGAKEGFRQTDTEGLKILTSGKIPANPSELLISTHFERFLAELSDIFDLIIVDSPPVSLVTDAAIIGSKVDGVILVVEAGKTSRHVVNKAKEALEKVKAKIIGVVLNKQKKGRGSYSYYRSGY